MASKKTSIPTLKFHTSGDDGGGGGGGERSAYNGVDGADEEDATQRLETAVRKISRGGSPNLQRSPGVSSSPTADPFRFEGLSGLARGYEQYRESLTAFRFPVTTEFGEASSDDLSSEWESCSSDLEHNNNSSSNVCSAARPMTPVLEMSEEVAKRALETVENANSQLAAATKFKVAEKAAAVSAVSAAASEGSDGEMALGAPRKHGESGGGGAGAAASRSESPPPRKLALPPAPTHRADQPKRVR